MRSKLRLKISVLAILLVGVVAFQAAHRLVSAATVVTLGNNTVGQFTDKSNAGYMTGSRFTTGELGGTLSSISVRVGLVGSSTNNRYQVAIYADSNDQPGARIASSTTGTLTANSWNTRPITANLAANTSYWLMYNANGSATNRNNMLYSESGGTSAWSADRVSFGTWPTTFGAASKSEASYSIYATYTAPDPLPTVNITAPTDNLTVSGSQSITATASNAVGVQFRLDGNTLGAEDTTSPYSVDWDTTTASQGSHTLTATARNSDGVTATSTVTVTVDNTPATPPTVNITSPAVGATLTGNQIVTASASDAVSVSGVQFKLDGNNLGAEDTTAPYEVSWNTATAANGSHTLTATARNGAGLTTTSSEVGVIVDNPPPTGGDGIWHEIAPASVSSDFNNPSYNYGFNSIVLDPNNASVLYVGTNYQGLWKSTDAGASWFKVNTGTGGSMLDQGRIWTLAVDPFNSNILWATSGYGAGGPLKSTDGGVSWTKLPVGDPTNYDDVYSIYLDPYTPNHVIMAWHSAWKTDGANSGVTESLDGGATWINHQPPAGSSWGGGNAVWFLDNSQTWLLGSQSDGIWRTTNSGATWTKVSNTSITHGGVNSLTKVGNTYYLAHNQDVDMSTDNGATWTDISAGLPGDYFASIATDGTYLYTAPSFPVGASYINGPWWRRPISGGNWTQMTNSPNTCRTYNSITNCNGPVMSAYDPVNHIAYTVNWNGGVWKFQPE